MKLLRSLLVVLALVPAAMAMPEIREIIASYLHLVYLLRFLCFFVDFDPKNPFENPDSPQGWQLEAIWADPVKDESDHAKKGSRKADRLPFEVVSGDKTTRGSQKGKKKSTPSYSSSSKKKAPAKPSGRHRLWPPGFDSLEDFKLVNVYHTARSLILDFGVCYLDVSFKRT